MLKDKIRNRAKTYFPDVVKMRRYLHAHPELSYEEVETGKYVAQKLAELGIPHVHGVAENGVVGLIEGRNPSKKIVALRADMDALPITEANDAFEVTGHVELTPVLQALPETAAIPIRRETTVRARTVEATPAARQPQPNKENEFFTPAVTTMQATPVALAPATTTPAAEQQTFRLGQEDRGRFKDTEPAIVQGEDLDIPTWMRLRKKLKR